jgi:hypothetical protein
MATDPEIVFINNTLGSRKTSRGALAAQFNWFWDSAARRLYLYAPGDPDTYYTNPGVEYRVRNQCIGLSANYLVFDGLTAEKSIYANFNDNSPGSYGIIRNCISQYADNGIAMGGPQGALYTGWEIHDNVARYNAVLGISVLYRGTHIQVYRNQCYENDTVINDTGGGWTGGIKLYDDTATMEDVEVFENVCYANGRGAASDSQGRGVGIWLDSVQPPAYPNLVYRNSVSDCRGNGIFVEITSHTRVWANVVSNCGTTLYGDQEFTPAGIVVDTREDAKSNDNLIYNNTVYGGRAGIKVASYAQGVGMDISNNQIKNNIVIGQTEHRLLAIFGGENVRYGSGNVYEYNCFGAEASNFIQWGTSNKSTYAAWEAAYGGSTHSVQADPQLSNGAGGDFTLRATSPCIDAGADLGPSYSTALLPGSSWPSNVRTGNQSSTGQRWEVGAYLFLGTVSGTPTPTPTTGVPPTVTPTPPPFGPTPTPVPSAPPVPTGVSASDGTFSDRVRITWTASVGATGYWIYRNTAASPPATEIAWVNSPGYDDSTAVPGQAYWYWVRAGNVYGWSTYSAYDTGFRATGPVPTPTATPRPGSPAASFTFSPETPTPGQQVQFTDGSSGASAWDWDFGDGSRASVRNPKHTYAVRGTYTVVLWVGNGINWSQAEKTVTITTAGGVRKHLFRG